MSRADFAFNFILYPYIISKTNFPHPDSWPSSPGREFLVSAHQVRTFVCTFVIPALPYLPTGLAGYSVGSGISRGARKLTRTPQVIKKKKKLIFQDCRKLKRKQYLLYIKYYPINLTIKQKWTCFKKFRLSFL